MPYEVRKSGRVYEVVNTETGEVHTKCKTKKEADTTIDALTGSTPPDKVKRLPNGTTANIYFKNKESYNGSNS